MFIIILPSYVASVCSVFCVYVTNPRLLVWTPMYTYLHVSLCYSYVLVWCFSHDRHLQDLSLTTGFCYYFSEYQR